MKKTSTKRGDTLIEVMLAIGFFALVSIITLAMMNSSINNAERDLELVTARYEINAQAEALRFIHGAYVAEKTLPLQGTINPSTGTAYPSDTKFQQYDTLWKRIISHAITPLEAEQSGLLSIGATASSCDKVYENGAASASPLSLADAFIINTRSVTSNTGNTLIEVNSSSNIFKPTDLSARIIYGRSTDNSDHIFDNNSQQFKDVYAAEGIWDFVVTDGKSTPSYYDFYIQACWYGPRALRPTILDTVVRLYNPENN